MQKKVDVNYDISVFSLVYFASVSMDVSRSKYLSVKCTLTVQVLTLCFSCQQNLRRQTC